MQNTSHVTHAEARQAADNIKTQAKQMFGDAAPSLPEILKIKYLHDIAEETKRTRQMLFGFHLVIFAIGILILLKG